MMKMERDQANFQGKNTESVRGDIVFNILQVVRNVTHFLFLGYLQVTSPSPLKT